MSTQHDIVGRKLVITGASGFVGQMFVPRLQACGVQLLLVGRDPAKLCAQFEGTVEVCTYDEIAQQGQGFDAVLHLAVRNNDRAGSLEAFRATNVTLLEQVISAARAANIPSFIATSTLQASDRPQMTPYGQSKREAEDVLKHAAQEGSLQVTILRLPAVYGDRFAGKLGLLNGRPRPLQKVGVALLSALRPVVHIDHLVAAIQQSLAAPQTDPNSGALSRPVISDRQMTNLAYRGVMRGIDLVIAVAILVGFSWLLLLVWAAVRLTSPGPGFFVQDRVGHKGAVFSCYKFRTMQEGTPNKGSHEVSAAQITKIGHLLRRTKLDELPQCWNIIRNDMSFVGPRPCLPSQPQLIQERDAHGVLDVKGGITGWAQIAGIDMSDPVRLAQVDAEYLGLRSIPLDLKIMVATFRGRGQGDKVRVTASDSPNAAPRAQSEDQS